MHPSRLFFLVMVSALGVGCSSGDAFVDRGYMTKSVKKQRLPGYAGTITVCYGSDTPRTVRDDLAREACGVYGLQPVMRTERRWQCRFTVPHSATYSCVDPNMRTPTGGYINPFNAGLVDAWSKANGKAAKASPPTEDEPEPTDDTR